MGTPAVKLDDKTPDQKPEDKEEELESEVLEQEEVEDDEDAPQKKQLSQDEVNAIVSKQKQRLKKDNQKLAEDSEKTAKELAAEREKNKLLQLALEQKKSGPPDPKDYEGGEFDPEFIKAKDEYTQTFIDQRVQEGLTEVEKKRQEQEAQREKSRSLEQRQEQHYQRVNELDVKDYIEKEDKVLEILGHDAVNEIIANFDDSHLLFYHLGNNPAKAERLSDLIKSSPIKGVAEIGRIQASLQAEPKPNNTPEPEEELEGGTAPRSSKEARLDALQQKYEKGKINLNQLLEERKRIHGKT